MELKESTLLKLEIIQEILESNKIKLTLEQLLEDIITNELEKTMKYVKK